MLCRWRSLRNPVLAYLSEHGAKLPVQGARIITEALVGCNALMKSLFQINIDIAVFAIA